MPFPLYLFISSGLCLLCCCLFAPGTRHLSRWCESSAGARGGFFPELWWCFHSWNSKCNLSLAWKGMYTLLQIYLPTSTFIVLQLHLTHSPDPWSLESTEWQLQVTINWLSLWSQGNGFKFLVTKTTCMHFCRHRGLFPTQPFHGHQASPTCRDCQILGLVSDGHLVWEPHIPQIRMKCQ